MKQKAVRILLFFRLQTLLALSCLMFFSQYKKKLSTTSTSASSLHYLQGGISDKVQKVNRTKDGGFIFSGYTIVGQNNTKAFLLKVDGSGKQEWYLTYGGPNYNRFNDAIQCSDGGFVAVGVTTMTGAGSFNLMDYVVKTNASGELKWSKSFTEGSGALCELKDVAEDANGNLYATGNYPSSMAWMASWFLKFDLSGKKLRDYAIEGLFNYKPNKFSSNYSIGWGGGADIEIGKNGEVLIGSTLVIYSTPEEYIPGLISLNSNGVVNYYFPYKGFFHGTQYNVDNKPAVIKIISDVDGYYLFYNRDTNILNEARPLIQILKTDLQGNPIWTKLYKGLGSALVFDVLKESDGTMLISGMTSTYAIDNSFSQSFYSAKSLILKIDKNGNELFQKYSDNSTISTCYKSIQRQSNGDYIGAGYSTSNSSSYDQMFITKLSSIGNLISGN